MNAPIAYDARPDIPVHVYDLSDYPVPRGSGFYYNIPLDCDTGEYVPPEKGKEVVLEGPFPTAYAARDAALALIEDALTDLEANEKLFSFVDEADLAAMEARGTA